MGTRYGWLLITALVTACFMEPDELRLARITGIEVPETIAPTDTLRIVFNWAFPHCHELAGMNADWTMDQITFSVTYRSGPGGWSCPETAATIGTHALIILPSQRRDPFVLLFRQPWGTHVRIVRSQ